MIAITQRETASAFQKLQQLTARILRMRQSGKFYSIPQYKQLALVKRHDRYLNKIIKTEHPVSKALGLLAVAMLFSMESQAQVECRQFVNADRDNPFALLKLSSRITEPVFVDIDNDGDLDCYSIGSSYYANFAFFRNTGTKQLPSFKPEATGGFPDETTIKWNDRVEGMVFSDIDGDGDYDCFIGYYGGNYDNHIVYFENVGTRTNPSFVEGSANPLGWVGGAYGLYFNLVDIDADGDYDLYTYDLYYNNFYRNTGTKTNPVFTRESHEENGINFQNAHTIFIDWNKDGTLDYIKTHVPNKTGNYTNQFYKNDGTMYNPHFTKDAADGPLFPTNYNLYSMVDLNNDGFAEAFSYTDHMTSTVPVAKIKTIQTTQGITLQAYPKGNYTFLWKRNRITIPNATEDSLQVTQSGHYIVEITGNCGTGISLPYYVTINNGITTLSPGEDDLSASVISNVQLHLYPNPFTDECVLKFDKGIAGNAMIYVTDVQGRIITSVNANNNDEVRFGRKLTPGVYFIQVINDQKVIFRQQIVKQ